MAVVTVAGGTTSKRDSERAHGPVIDDPTSPPPLTSLEHATLQLMQPYAHTLQ